MAEGFKESDWRQFKAVHEILRDRYCQQVLDEISAKVTSAKGTPTERFWDVVKMLKKRAKEQEDTFADYRRSTAFFQLLRMRRLGLLTDEELSRFSEQLQQQIRYFAEM